MDMNVCTFVHFCICVYAVMCNDTKAIFNVQYASLKNNTVACIFKQYYLKASM